jgi:two-component system phosphate regulon sensor histidine kinase PhoR
MMAYVLLIGLFLGIVYLFPETPIIILLFSLLTALVLSYGVSRWISRPIRMMTEAARTIAKGHASLRVRVRSRDEIGELARAMNEMAERVKATLDRIMEEKTQLQAVLSSMTEGVMVTDHRGRIIITNHTFKHRFTNGRTPDGQLPIEVIRDAVLQETINRLLRAPGSETLALVTSSGETFDVHLARLPSRDGSGGIVALFHDITDFKRLEQIRRDFVANISHELRTPLTTIYGCAETLLDGALDDRDASERFVRTIVRHTERLSHLTDDLLDLAQLESGKIDLNCRFIPLRPIVERVIHDFGQPISNKHLTCSVDLPTIFPHLYADETLLEQALTNLIDNAIKHTPEGGQITITARHQKPEKREWGTETDDKTIRRQDETGEERVVADSPFHSLADSGDEGEGKEGWVEIIVADTGTGIPHDAIPRIFERFYRVDRSRSRELGGTGLGLAIVKHIAEVHGGSVHVESTLGKGSTFTLRLPTP